MMFNRYSTICYCILFFVFMSSIVAIGTTSTQPSYPKADDDSSSEDNPPLIKVSRSEQPKDTIRKVPHAGMIKNVHYIIPNKDDDKKQLNFANNQQGSELPQTSRNSQQNIEQRKQRENLEVLLTKSNFDFDESKESFQYRKGHSTKIHSNSYCVKITPLYSKEGACEKELVKIYQNCDSTPYEVFKTTCYHGSDFVVDNALRLDNYLYSVTPNTLVFMLNDGSCLKKEYFEPYSEPELKDKSYCNEIKRLVRNIEERNNDKTVPFNIEENSNHAPPIFSILKGDNVQHDRYVSPEKSSEVTEKSDIPKERDDEVEESEDSDVSSNKNSKQDVFNEREKVLPPEKRKVSIIRRLIQKNPLRRLIKRKQKKKDFSIVLVYDKNKKPLDL